MPRRVSAFLFLCAIFCVELPVTVPAATTIVDVVPARLEREEDQNSEPSIAVNPANPNQMFVTAFGNTSARNPIFWSTDGGATWSLFTNIATSDTTISWTNGGLLYLAQTNSRGDSVLARSISVTPWRTAFRARMRPLGRGNYRPGGYGPDQPWVAASNANGVDRIYVAMNDLSQPTNTASVRFSLDGGTTWTQQVVENVTPGDN